MPLSSLLAFATYVSALILISILSYRKTETAGEFVTGGRSLNFWVTALSAHASDMSSWLFLAFPMAVFLNGAPAIWIATGLFLGMFLCWHLIAPALRRETEKYDCYTISSYFERRLNDKTGIIRVVSAIMTLIFMINYLAVGLVTVGITLENFFDIDYTIGITVTTLLIVCYTMIGGFITVAWTDTFQAIFLLACLILVPILSLNYLPHGWASISEEAARAGLSLSLFKGINWTSALYSALGWGLGYFGQLHILTKFMGIRDPNELTKSRRLGLSWQAIALGSASMIGLIGIAMFPSGLANPELLFVETVKILFTPYLAGIVLCAMIAATISTMDSQILVCAGVLSEDLYRVFLSKNPTKKGKSAEKSRISVLITALIALLIASQQHSIMDSVVYSWTGLGCSFGPLILMCLYDKKTNLAGGCAGVLTGGIIAAFWLRIAPFIGLEEIPAMIPAFAAALASIYFVSRTSKNLCTC